MRRYERQSQQLADPLKERVQQMRHYRIESAIWKRRRIKIRVPGMLDGAKSMLDKIDLTKRTSSDFLARLGVKSEDQELRRGGGEGSWVADQS